MIEFFIPLEDIPHKTFQAQRITCKNGKPIIYKDTELQNIENMFLGCLYSYAPDTPLQAPIRLTVKWLFKSNGKYQDGQYKTTKPDTDNLLKLFKDCMTKLKFFKDDSNVASEINEKFWAKIPGIYVKVEELQNIDK